MYNKVCSGMPDSCINGTINYLKVRYIIIDLSENFDSSDHPDWCSLIWTEISCTVKSVHCFCNIHLVLATHTQ